ncbi:hypothetical protein BWQ96_06267 [Gracilariopsis chorda]|uniref:DDE Tnp4 domain-containing protein n=1 Tax=Gracilariopsis chorda TaxID=448386 RepID=A0A2V3IPH6_9FLOR|nr:hypothetical protein BWQ96_06267 [Gracilariopsis chorda]|eukprot:PXF43957.1 hypothetical protein BWQ96_06267 [Gracilariopsis chorda]
MKPSYTVNSVVIDCYYYLTRGIYPKWKIFIHNICQSINRKEKLFSRRQESVRKVVERVFGVLYRWFKSLFVKTERFNMENVRGMATAAVVMHNMIVKHLRTSYSSICAAVVSRFFNEDEDCTDFVVEQLNELDVTVIVNKLYVTDDIKLSALQQRLQNALQQHIWELQSTEIP